MPTLTIGDKKITVGDEFMKLSPEDQQATVDEIEASLPQAAAPSHGVTAGGILKAGGEGLRKGAEYTAGMFGDVANMNASGADWLAQKLGASPETAGMIGDATKFIMPGGPSAPTTQQVQAGTEQILPEHHTAANMPEKFVQTAAEFLPAALLGKGHALKELGQRAITQGIIPGLASEGAGELAQKVAPEYEPQARIAGALIAPHAMSPFPANAERLKMAETLAKEGVDLTAGQKTGSERLRYMEGELGGFAGQKQMETQAEQFTKAALSKAGITDASRATPEVMDAALTRMGKTFDDLASTSTASMDKKLNDDLLDAAVGYQRVKGNAAAPLVEDTMQRIADAGIANGGSIPGDVYKTIRSDINAKMRSTADPELKGALRDMQEALDDAIERSIPPEKMAEWKKVRKEYRNFLVLEQAATGAGENAAAGLISPSALRNATVQKQGRRNYGTGEGDFADLARAGEGTMKPLPNSGTAGRLNAKNMGQGILSLLGGGAGAMHSPEAAMAGMVAGGILPGVLGKAILSAPGRAILGNQMGGGIDPKLRALAAALLAGPHGTPAIAP